MRDGTHVILIAIAFFAASFVLTLAVLVVRDWDCVSDRTGQKRCIGTIMATQDW